VTPGARTSPLRVLAGLLLLAVLLAAASSAVRGTRLEV
jgi:hypothetical protein